MAHIGRENDLERLNKEALRMAREVADETGTLMAGNISKVQSFESGPGGAAEDKESIEQMFKVCAYQTTWGHHS